MTGELPSSGAISEKSVLPGGEIAVLVNSDGDLIQTLEPADEQVAHELATAAAQREQAQTLKQGDVNQILTKSEPPYHRQP